MKTIDMRIRALLLGSSAVCALALTAGPLAASTLVSTMAPEAPAAAAAPAAASDRLERAISADDKPNVLSRAHGARAALGMPDGARSKALHVKDLGRAVEYDEVVEEDTAGQPLALTQVDGNGGLLLAVRFDLPGKGKGPVGREDALKLAKTRTAHAVIDAEGQSETSEAASGGWDVVWPRVQNGVRVRGDEIRVHVREDGVIGSVGQVKHALAAAPRTKLSPAQAKAMAGDRVRGWSAQAGVDFAIGGAELAWVAPNAAFETSKTAPPDQPYRLSWVVDVTPQGEAASYVRQVTLFLDAGDGSLLGGDLIE